MAEPALPEVATPAVVTRAAVGGAKAEGADRATGKNHAQPIANQLRRFLSK